MAQVAENQRLGDAGVRGVWSEAGVPLLAGLGPYVCCRPLTDIDLAEWAAVVPSAPAGDLPSASLGPSDITLSAAAALTYTDGTV